MCRGPTESRLALKLCDTDSVDGVCGPKFSTHAKMQSHKPELWCPLMKRMPVRRAKRKLRVLADRKAIIKGKLAWNVLKSTVLVLMQVGFSVSFFTHVIILCRFSP